MKETALVIMAAGIGSRFGGGIKQLEPVGPGGEIIMDYSIYDALKAGFEALGYEYLGEFGIPGRRYMRRGGDERTHQVHVFSVLDTANITRHLAFRDYLCAHPDVCAEYAALKRALAGKYPFDIGAYCDGKEEFVKKHEAAALAWAGGGHE